MTGKGLKSIGDRAAEKARGEQLEKDLGINEERQDYFMYGRYTPEKHAELNKKAKRTVDWSDREDLKYAVQELAIREGWRYWDGGWSKENALHRRQGRIISEKAKMRIEEADYRDTWIVKYHAKDIDLFPMDFKNEGEYAYVVHMMKELRSAYVKDGVALGYNLKRQEELEEILKSLDEERIGEIIGIVKYSNLNVSYEREHIIRQIALRENWRFHSSEESRFTGKDDLLKQRLYLLYIKALRAREQIEEVDRRDAWMERCEHGKEVRLFPMDFKNEETYRVAVEFEYERMKDREDPCRVPYNIDRQRELESLLACRRLDENDAKRISKVLGRKVHSITNDDIYEISVHEGWKYYFTDGKFHGDTRLRCMNKAYESIARKKWITRCPHGDEVDVYPLDYPNEEAYQSAVEAAYEKRKAEIK